ncbi:hypothetical protein CYLTODRAFT_419927 [Cylindrobasidium torrendii FP15055 ss-10]|uniref:Uncharacterized protein n=1 Tax=Cylindrobasidium torrendii FP15055 ss-10 TaxID=1314674 RepID=A0A0D7BJD9_9AGAR|nr:hypothetical protein CYLTODRAFT_419927 [Cylindrobasidium torrendii FP15055 ss-10]
MSPPPFYHAITPYRGLNGASPLVKDLPIELLSYIFILATHSSDIPNTILAITAGGVAVPARIAMVSKYWRAVAQSTPALWTSLCATVDTICRNEAQREMCR